MHAMRFGVVLFFIPIIVFAQQAAAPKYEVRAVWLTTLLGLDWPSNSMYGDTQAQQQSLREIFDNLDRMNFNTVMFQVRSRGNTFYESSIEPYASELTGTLGKNPGWDPLQFAIDEAHARGLELHAWINVFRVWTGGNNPPHSEPLHIAHKHPNWVKPFRNELWVDPGIPEARKYFVDLCVDLITRYDVDGLHLDYCRYPDAMFDDNATYRKYGNDKPKADWRRENIDQLVREVYSEVTQRKPWIKIGSAPIGIYENLPTAKGWQGLHSVYQDSRRWLKEGYHDYVAPQVYWGMTSHKSKIDFEALVYDWQSHSSGKHVYIGMAAYRPEVAPFLSEEIDVTRKYQSAGQCYFRYRFVEDPKILQNRYVTKSLVPAMNWKNPPVGIPPTNLIVEQNSDGSKRISWSASNISNSDYLNSKYVVYRSVSVPVNAIHAENILAILSSVKTSFVDNASDQKYHYAVSALNRYDVESSAAQEKGVFVTPAPSLVSVYATSVSDNVDIDGQKISLIGFSIAQYGYVKLRLTNKDGNEIALLIDEKKEPGLYVIGINRESVSQEISGYIFEAGDYRVAKTFTNNEMNK